MGRLNETSKGWQWDDGPIFPGPEGRRRAIEYGQDVMAAKTVQELNDLFEQRRQIILTLGLLEKEAEKRRNKT
jgi:hypothetical protein